MMGGGKKLFWSSGASSPHPRPVLEAFAALEMPIDMVEGDGYPPLTDAIKADILGRNYARLHGIDIAAAAARCAQDGIDAGRKQMLSPPWGNLPTPAIPDELASGLVA
jgi:hypothetical protein